MCEGCGIHKPVFGPHCFYCTDDRRKQSPPRLYRLLWFVSHPMSFFRAIPVLRR